MGPQLLPKLPDELADWPSFAPDEAQLADLELITSGVFAPLTGYMGAADLATVADRGTLADGTPWAFPVTLDVPAGAVPADADHLVLHDPEGTPLAVLEITERLPRPDNGPAPSADLIRLAGPVTALREPQHGPFRELRRRPADVRAELGEGPVLACVTRAAVHRRHIGQLRHLAGQMKARLLLLPLVGGPAEVVVHPESLVRAVLAARGHLPANTIVVPVPLAPRDADGGGDLRARATVAAAYGATHLLAEPRDTPGTADAGNGGNGNGGKAQTVTLPGVAVPLISTGEWAYDPLSEVWRPLVLIEPGVERGELSADELSDLLDRGDPLPSWFTPDEVARELRRARPPRRERGLVVLFTGLSGSGKSTIARDLRDALAERGDRTVSLLDGDRVRRLLSSGLSFSRADREANLARIGYVAAEIARHGGIAICAPIAPYASARARVRAMVAETGDFLLVQVATPLHVCEERDRKGLYAKARAGLIPDFTGISAPYEEPRDADVVVDTSQRSRRDAVQLVLDVLTSGGWLPTATGAAAENSRSTPKW